MDASKKKNTSKKIADFKVKLPKYKPTGTPEKSSSTMYPFWRGKKWIYGEWLSISGWINDRTKKLDVSLTMSKSNGLGGYTNVGSGILKPEQNRQNGPEYRGNAKIENNNFSLAAWVNGHDKSITIYFERLINPEQKLKQLKISSKETKE